MSSGTIYPSSVPAESLLGSTQLLLGKDGVRYIMNNLESPSLFLWEEAEVNPLMHKENMLTPNTKN